MSAAPGLSGRRGEQEDTVFSTSPRRGEVGRRPGEGAVPMTSLHHDELGCGRREVPKNRACQNVTMAI
jgi:hypothetical protein